MRRLVQLLTLLLPVCAYSAEEHTPSWPLWDGRESVEQYARRTNLPPTKTLDLGNGVNLELVLIPAGKFVMGTPEPKPVDEEALHKKIVAGKAVLAAGGGILLVLICAAILRAIRKKTRFQYSLRRLMAMTFAASLCVLGGMHWRFTARTLARAQAEYPAALARYRNSKGGDEQPAHEVTLTKPFYMAKCKTTEEQFYMAMCKATEEHYQYVMDHNPRDFEGPKFPVDMVSWDDAQGFCKKVSEQLPHTMPCPASGEGNWTACLPTEAEWEFACRAGTTTTYYSGDTEADLGRVAWYEANSRYTRHPVCQKEPNAFGLYDMLGNLNEWCQDWFDPFLREEAAVDPQGPPEGFLRVLRGGSLISTPEWCRSACRRWSTPNDRLMGHGFRLVVVVDRTP
ncbi:MAG: formylglycine-generating enzyme family protein [Planctomycetota bacterium]